MDRRRLLLTLPGLLAATAGVPVLAQQGYPSKPVRVVCGSTAGALLDFATRLYAEKMAEVLRQPLVVENMAGASSVLAARNVIRSAADGYTLLTAANTLLAMPHLSRTAGFRAADFTPIGEMARSPSILVVSPASGFNSVDDVISAARAHPGKIAFASGGVGTVSHMAAELFAEQARIKMLHVPYKGVVPAVSDVVSNRVALLIATPTSVEGLVKSGRLRVLAITSGERSDQYPAVPTFKDLGLPGATFEVWVGMFAPAGLGAPVLLALGKAMEAARNDAGIQRKLRDNGQTISDLHTPEKFASFVAQEDLNLARLIGTANITTDSAS